MRVTSEKFGCTRQAVHKHLQRLIAEGSVTGSGQTSSKTYRLTPPVKLMTYGDDNLVSRSQARRLLARFDRFKIVILDFSGISSIGQAFADEVFRVFRNKHPEVELIPQHATADVKRMISRAEAHDASTHG